MEVQGAALRLEIDRAIPILRLGLEEKWQIRDQYLSAFEKTSNTDLDGRSVEGPKRWVGCVISTRLRVHQVWDEGLPIGVEVKQLIAEFESTRKSPSIQPLFLPCSIQATKMVTISAGVASNMLTTRVPPVYPDQALKNHVSGVVILNATINDKGNPENVRVISGPVLLRQAALEAVQQWTYRPYTLNGRPIEVETTIKIAFIPKP